jgi:hypothetical protein
MKYLNIFLGLVLVVGIVHAQQKTEFSQRDVRDPRRLAVHLEDNATDVETRLQAVSAFFADGLLSQGDLAIGSDTTKIKTEATAYYTIDGIQYSRTAVDDRAFSAADTINVAEATNTSFFGAWLIEVDAAGSVATKPSGGLTNQVFESGDAAVAALPSATENKVALGYVLIDATTITNFVAQTTALTTNIATFVDAPVKTIP